MMRRLAVALAVAMLGAQAVRADTDDLQVDLRVHLPILVVAAGAGIGLGSMPLPSGCVICSSQDLDEDAREIFRLGSPRLMRDARRASDSLVSLVLPAGALAASGLGAYRDGSPRHLYEDAIVVAEAATIAADLNTLAKHTLSRRRPDAAGEVAGESFYSSHTSRAFALAVSTATVATIRGRRGAPWLWGAGLTLSTGVAYLRVASDSHWLSDVAVGAAVGSAVGFAVPWFLHRGHSKLASSRHRFDVQPAPGGLAVAL
jgi:hypothetical protein